MRILGLLLGVALALLAPAASAQDLNPCIFNLPCIGGGAEGFGFFVQDSVIPYMLIVFVAIGFWVFFYYAFRLITESRENENVIKEARDGYAQLLYACTIVGVATFIVAAFGRNAADTLVNPEPLNTVFSTVTLFFRIIVGVTLTAVIVAQGFLIIISSEEGEIDKHRKRLINAILGVGVMLIANALVRALQPGANSGIFANEVRGIANYLLVLMVLMAVVAIIVAGAFYLLSVNEDLKEKAKNTIKTVVIATIIVVCAYVIVFFFIDF